MTSPAAPSHGAATSPMRNTAPRRRAPTDQRRCRRTPQERPRTAGPPLRTSPLRQQRRRLGASRKPKDRLARLAEGILDIAGGQPARIHLAYQPLKHLAVAIQEAHQAGPERLIYTPHLRYGHLDRALRGAHPTRLIPIARPRLPLTAAHNGRDHPNSPPAHPPPAPAPPTRSPPPPARKQCSTHRPPRRPATPETAHQRSPTRRNPSDSHRTVII